MNEETPCNYDPYSCQSLLGYGKAVHERSGGVCAYCGFGKDGLSFEMWRQLSIDHVIPTSTVGTGGWSRVIECFPKLPEDQLKELYKKINEINLVTACNFCNSMTSRMKDISPDGIFPAKNESVTSVNDQPVQAMLWRLHERVEELLPIKRDCVQERLERLRKVFESAVVLHVGNSRRNGRTRV